MLIGRSSIVFACVAAALCAVPTAARGQIFQANDNGFTGLGSIGEYNLDGTPINASLITGLYLPQGIAASGSNLFVANGSGGIGEYSTSGATVNASLISGNFRGIVASGS